MDEPLSTHPARDDPPAQAADRSLSDKLDARARGELSRGRTARAVGSGRWARFMHWVLGGPPPAPLPSVLGVFEEPKEGRYGICCSGGGVRSAAFNLGAMQVLQAPENRVLQRADYLAAVSGGSYMAAGFAMVAQFPRDPPCDCREEAHAAESLVTDAAPPFHPGSPEEQYLRNRSSYMAPGLAGMARLVGRVLVGVLINLLFLGSMLFVAGWAFGWLVLGEWLHPGLREPDGNASTEAAAIVALALGGLAAVLALVATLVRFTSERPPRALYALAWCLLVLAAGGAVVFVVLPALIEWLREIPGRGAGEAADTTAEDLGGGDTAAVIGGSGTVALLTGIALQLHARMTDARVLARAERSVRAGVRGYLNDKVLPRARGVLLSVAAVISGSLVLGGIAFFSVMTGVVDGEPGVWMVCALLAASAFFIGLCLYGDVTSWSLHPFYRRRLSTAFALQRIPGEGNRPIAKERDYATKLPLSTLVSHSTDESGTPREWPELVVCAAANVSDPGATPPGRAVTSFTFSPTFIGGPLIGTVATCDFERQLKNRSGDFTLPAAVAMSGAALSPSMGKMTRGPLRLLLTLGNARLGVWVPNPRRFKDPAQHRGTGVARFGYWRPRPLLLLNEMLGRNSADAKFLYVTDGGHYENLGLVELLRRGCRDIYCFDASGGSDIQELGDAIALARTELQVEVSITPAAAESLIPGPNGLATTDCVTGQIRFKDGQYGTLVYARSVLTETAPHDVRAYQQIDPDFPHNSTGDQLYDDQRFEAYRILGREAAGHALTLFRARPRPSVGQ